MHSIYLLDLLDAAIDFSNLVQISRDLFDERNFYKIFFRTYLVRKGERVENEKKKKKIR